MNHIDFEYIGRKFDNLQNQTQKEHFSMKIQSNQIPLILDLWRRNLSTKHFSDQFRLLNLSVKYLTKYRASECKLVKSVTAHELDHFGLYVLQSKQFDVAAAILCNLHFKIKSESIRTCQSLFKLLIVNFQHIQSDEVREQLTQLLVELMGSNNDLVKLANQPYYFLQYLLFRINQEQSQDQVVKWCQNIKKIFLSPQSQGLFTESDFKILVDVVVRHIQNFSEERKLVVYLQTYLVLSIFPFIKTNGKYHKIDQILMVVSDLSNKSQQIQGLAGEIASLKFQTM